MKILSVFLLVLVQALFCFVVLEMGSYFFLQKSGNALYRTRRVLQADASLGWLLRSDLNTTFEGRQLQTDSHGYRSSSDVNSFELLTLGPSSAFGWGVEAAQTYTEIVANELNLKAVNASQIGYSVVQGFLLWKKNFNISAHHPKYVILAYGINDLDKFRFYTEGNAADDEYFKRVPLAVSWMTNAEKKSHFLTLLSLAAQELGLRSNCSSLAVIQQRVSLQEYEAYLDQLIQDFQRYSITPVLVGTPYFLKAANKNYTVAAIDKKYELVKQAAAANNCTAALNALGEAKQLEPDRIAEDVFGLNAFLRAYAERNHFAYVDAQQLLSGEEQNYVDPVHPSARGHNLIARKIIADIISSRYGK